MFLKIKHIPPYVVTTVTRKGIKKNINKKVITTLCLTILFFFL